MCDQPGYTSLAVGGEGESPMVCGRLVHTSLLVVRCQGDILGTSITGVWLQLAQGLCPGISISSLSWAGFLTSLCLSFLICKTGTIPVTHF